MNTQENNKLIAEFMQSIEDGLYLDGLYFYNGGYYDTNMEFHKSWDWLMPVVDRIETLSGELPTHIGNIPNDEDWESNNFLSTNIKETYQAVVEFINQYNKTK